MNALTRLDRFDDLWSEFRRFMQPLSRTIEPMGEIRLDIDEDDKAYTVRAEMPGVKKDDVRVEIDGNLVSISAEVRKDVEEKEKADGRVLVRETYRGSASRSFSLAHEIDKEHAVAKLEDGMLKLTLTKRKGVSTRRLAIE